MKQAKNKDKGFLGTCPKHNQDIRKCDECMPEIKINRTVLDLFWQTVEARRKWNPNWERATDTFKTLCEQAAEEFKE